MQAIGTNKEPTVHDHRNLFNELKCRVEGTPLCNAVALIPCGHTISEVAAKALAETGSNCVHCGVKFTQYITNHAIEAVVKAVSGPDIEVFVKHCRRPEQREKMDVKKIMNEWAGQEFNRSHFSGVLGCPLRLRPLADAVMLIPCGHTISEVAARSLATHSNCVLCSHHYNDYKPNLAMRVIVRAVYGPNVGQDVNQITLFYEKSRARWMDQWAQEFQNYSVFKTPFLDVVAETDFAKKEKKFVECLRTLNSDKIQELITRNESYLTGFIIESMGAKAERVNMYAFPGAAAPYGFL